MKGLSDVNGDETIKKDSMLFSSNVQHIIHVEILQVTNSLCSRNEIEAHVQELVATISYITSDIIITTFSDPILTDNVIEVQICHVEGSEIEGVNLKDCRVIYHVYKLESQGSDVEELEEEEGIPAAHHWILPNAEFHKLWDSLVYGDNIKSKLLNFVNTTLLFADKQVDPNIISCNKVVLLHGPPGTGKTSLCKALANKLAIRLNDRFRYGQLIEINSHSLFSKWFSESGKLVLKMFSKIHDMITDTNSLVCVLIDEVESLTRSRVSSTAGSEPSDAIRVVNALLTQLDQIKKYPNVLILTTSNITGTIDLAFVDRADIKLYVGFPSLEAVYKIYSSIIKELIDKGVIFPADIILPLSFLDMQEKDLSFTVQARKLKDISEDSVGICGRTLRKLPFLAHAYHLQTPVMTLDDFLIALKSAVRQYYTDMKNLEQ